MPMMANTTIADMMVDIEQYRYSITMRGREQHEIHIRQAYVSRMQLV